MSSGGWLDSLGSKGARPLIIAHRGDSFRAPENTLEAARLGFGAGAFAWELDVHLSLDLVPVVIHDESLLRTTNVAAKFADDPRRGLDYPVSRFTVDELKTLDAGSWFLSESGGARSARGFRSLDRVPVPIVEACRKGDVKIPTLREALVATRDWNWRVNVEIKSFPNPRDHFAEIVLAEIDALGMAEQVLISSFNHPDMAAIRRLSPTITTGLLVHQPLYDTANYLSHVPNLNCYHVSSEALGSASDRYRDAPCSQSLNRSQISGLIERGSPVLVYTVNDGQTNGLATHLAELGVSALFTDDPVRLVRLFAGKPDQA